jgi:hypothetical protein
VVGSQGILPLDVLVETNGGVLQGRVLGIDRKPAANVGVILIPAPDRRQTTAFYKTVRSDAQGQFTIAAIAPGDYKLFAWESILPGAYRNAKFLEKFEERGAPVTVTRGTTVRGELELIR